MSKKSTKNPKTVKLNFKDEQTKDASLRILHAMSSELSSSIDRVLRSSGYGSTDTTISFNQDKQEFFIDPVPADKGKVLVVANDALEFVEYSDLEHDDFYASVKDGSVKVYKFEKDGLDQELGVIKTLSQLEEELASLPDRLRVMKAQEEMKKAKEEAKSE